MLKEKITEFFKDLGYILKRIFTSRIIPFVLVAIILFGVLAHRFFVLQIVKGDSYTSTYTMKNEKTISTKGTRGNIYDSEGRLLAYSDLAYSVIIEDCGYYSSKKVKNEALNRIISKMINIIEENGDEIVYDYGIDYGENGYYYTVEDNALLRFLRDVYGHKSISGLTEKERNATAADTAKFLRNKYAVMTKQDVRDAIQAEKEEIANNPDSGKTLTDYSNQDTYDELTAIRIAYIRTNLDANSYKRYISFTVAKNVNSHTMASILENSDILTGVSIAEETIRRYDPRYSVSMAHILGYTGKASAEELEQLQATNPSYDATDLIGKAGIEKSYEQELSGTKGQKTMLVDSVGRVIEVTSETPSQVGRDVYLTIDAELQTEIYNLLERRIAEVLVTYLTSSDNAYPQDDLVLVPATDVYFALINNNVIDMKEISESQTDTAIAAYALFSERKAQMIEAVRAEFESGTVYNDLDDDTKSFIKLVIDNLKSAQILNSSKISSQDEIQDSWNNGTISFKDYLMGTIKNQWVNIYNLDVSSEYPTIDEVMEEITEESIRMLEADTDFDKLMYKYLIKNHKISGYMVCRILMEQGAVEFTDDEYTSMNSDYMAYEFIKDKILSLKITPAQLALNPCSGSCVVEDPTSGQVQALVSYPSYDINYFSGSINKTYYNKLLDDKSTPLVDRATQTKIAPGSTFKPLMAIAGVCEGVISPDEQFYCDGICDEVTPNIKCHVYPGKHGSQDLSKALLNSCNDYFCEIGYRLCFTPSGTINFNYGLTKIKEYADAMGIGTKSGIQIPEAEPHVTDYNAVVSAIGQGTNAYTVVNMGRYVSTLADKGTVYNSSIVSKTCEADGSNEQTVEPVIASQIDVNDYVWESVHSGMQMIASTGPVSVCFNRFTSATGYTIYGKSGTAEENKLKPSHAIYIIFTEDEEGNPDKAISAMIPYGHTATQAGIMTYYALSACHGTSIPKTVMCDSFNQWYVEE